MVFLLHLRLLLFLSSVILSKTQILPHKFLIFLPNYEKHAPRVSQVIAAVAKVSCKHGLWLVARVNQKSGMPHDTPYLEYSTISLLFCHEYFSLFPAIFVFYHTGFFVFIEKDQFAFSPPVCYTVFIYFRNFFFIYRKAYNL